MLCDEELINQTLKILITKWSDYYHKAILSQWDKEELLNNPKRALEFIFWLSFARAGAENVGYNKIAINALNKAIKQYNNDFPTFISPGNSAKTVWDHFVKECNAKGIGVNEKLNKGVIEGIIYLTKESGYFNIFRYLGDLLKKDALSAYLKLYSVKGIGPKISSFILRDIAFIYEIEDYMPKHKLYPLQPIDRWVGRIALLLWPELRCQKETSHYLIALKIVDECSERGYSSIRFNQGAWMYGSTIGKIPKDAEKLMYLLKNSKYH